MGGIGSGRRFHPNAKVTVDSCSSIDIRYLKKRGVLSAGCTGKISWSRNGHQSGSIGFRVTENGLMLSYTTDGQGFRYLVPIVHSSCNFGGRRPWLQCTKCGRRVGKLMLSNKMFVCRHCGDLVYQSPRERKTGRMLNRVRKLRERLGGTINAMEPIPPRPKGMHWRTYWRICNEIQHFECGMWSAFAHDLKLQ